MKQESRIKLVLLSVFELSAVDVTLFCWPSGPLDQQLYVSERPNGIPDPLQLVVELPIQHVHQCWSMKCELWNLHAVISLEAGRPVSHFTGRQSVYLENNRLELVYWILGDHYSSTLEEDL